MSILPRHVLITGASSGLGAALARAYAAPGRRLTLIGRDVERLAAVAADVETQGGSATGVAAEVTDAAAMADAVAMADARRPLDLVIANAGIAAAGDVDDGARVLEVNVLGVWYAVAPAVGLMARRGAGQLALMSSLAGYRGLPGAGPYCASKAAVRVLAESLRAEWAPAGIRVSAICPGFVTTPLTARNRFPMPWLMTPEDAALCIVRGLARDHARIAFPRRLDLLTRLAAALPARVIDPWLRRGAAGDQRGQAG